MMLCYLFLVLVIPFVTSHSWLTCPPSFNNFQIGRGGIQGSLCEAESAKTYVTHVEAGDRLKVGWTSNNHAGGDVRLSLVPYGKHLDEDMLKKNTMKFVCYGSPSNAKNGDCKHPCDGRPGCEYQSDNYDIHRFDTTIGIPTNLAPGYYVLHAAMIVGNGQAPYNSCAKLRIVGGNTQFNCKSDKPILAYSCIQAAGPSTAESIGKGTTRGDFCYRLDGSIGSVDDNLRHVPINVECDPRLSCKNSIAAAECAGVEKMGSILNAPEHSIQPKCRVYNVLPDPIPSAASCSDGIRNGDEEKVDCGGRFCAPCPTIKFSGDYYSNVVEDVTGNWGSGANIQLEVHIIRDISNAQCWQLETQFKVPISITGNPWFDGKLVDQHPDLKIMTFANSQQKNIVAGSKIKIAFGASNPKEEAWTDDTLQFLTALFVVHDDVSKCIGTKK